MLVSITAATLTLTSSLMSSVVLKGSLLLLHLGFVKTTMKLIGYSMLRLFENTLHWTLAR